MKKRRHSRLLRWIALGLAIAAFVAPSAQAAYQTEGGAVSTSVRDVTGTQTTSNDSNWGGAIAGVAVATLLLGGGIVVLQRRRSHLARA